MLSVALKEWSIVCDLLLEGSLALLLRKGGIHETGGPGVFELEYPRFALFPSWTHQRPQMIKPPYRDRVEVFTEEPATITFRGLGTVDHIWQVPSREAFDQLEDLHCWTSEQIDMRFDYKPERPLYLMAVRAYRLVKPKTINNNFEYAGCRSWVHLHREDEVDDTNATPVLDDATFQSIVDRIARAMTS